MRTNRYFVLVIIVLLVPVFVPLIRFDTNVSPPCARARLPCPLGTMTPIGSLVFWSLTAYYWGVGGFVSPGGYGFIGIVWLWPAILVLSFTALLLAAESKKRQSQNNPTARIPRL